MQARFYLNFWFVLSLLLSVALLPAQASAAAFDHQHSGFSTLLKQYVRWNAKGTSSAVDYASLKAQPAALNSYTASLSKVTAADLAGFSKAQRRALLINAYNAFTLQLILTKYPDLKSIKDLGGVFSSPWKKAFVPLVGRTISLDEIEHTLIRGAKDFDDPRIHFAVNCASIGCPALRDEAFTADKLDAQLHDQTQRFLKDRSRNYFAAAENTLYLSMIFKWYGSDFERGFLNAKSVPEFVANYGASLALTKVQQQAIKAGSLDLEYTEYDWMLNK
jgi:Protein of unknown function, DUF547